METIQAVLRTRQSPQQFVGPVQKCLVPKREGKKEYASHSNSISPDRSGRPTVAGEPFHPHGRQYQVDLERSRGHCGGGVALECVWTISFSLAYPCWLINGLTRTREEKRS